MSAEILRRAAHLMRERGDDFSPAMTEAIAEWLEDEAQGDGHMPHRFPTPAPDGEIISWVCQACGETVAEYLPRTDCTVDWRDRDPYAEAVAHAYLDGVAS